MGVGLLNETFETAITWDRFDAFVASIRATTEEALRSVDAWPGVVTCRLTHVYPDGAAPYFTVIAPGRRSGRLAQWAEVKAAVMDAIGSPAGPSRTTTRWVATTAPATTASAPTCSPRPSAPPSTRSTRPRP